MKKENLDLLRTLISMSRAGTLRGIFSDIPEEVYNDPLCPGVRSGQIKEIVSKSYSHWKSSSEGKEEKSVALEFGTAFHEYLLEPAKFDRTRVSAQDLATMMQIRQKALRHPEVAGLMDGSQKEVTCFSTCQETGILKRCRIDVLKPGVAISDVKTCTNASFEAFSRDARRFMYRIAAAHYTGIWFDLMGEHLRFFFIACEKVELYEAAVYQASAHSIAKGAEECREALQIISAVQKHGERAWTGYPLGVKELFI